MDESESLTLLRDFFLPLSNSCSFPWICWDQVQYTCFEVSQSGFRVCVGGPRGEFQLNSVETALYLMAYAAACLQEGPAMILLPIVTHWCSPLRTVCRPTWSVGYCRDDGKWLLRLGRNRHCSFCLMLFWVSCPGRSQLPYWEDTQAVLWGGPHGEELRHCANSWHELAMHERVLR